MLFLNNYYSLLPQFVSSRNGIMKRFVETRTPVCGVLF